MEARPTHVNGEADGPISRPINLCPEDPPSHADRFNESTSTEPYREDQLVGNKDISFNPTLNAGGVPYRNDFRASTRNVDQSPGLNSSILPLDQPVSADAHRIASQDIDWSNASVIGFGNGGEVYKGIWLKTQTVAMKRLVNDGLHPEELRKRFKIEWGGWLKLQHPYIVQFFGTYLDPRSGIEYIISHYMNAGNLVTLLRTAKPHEFDEQQRLSIACDVAQALIYLRSRKLVHGDIAARNVFCELSGSPLYQAKLGDFGFLRMEYSDSPLDCLPHQKHAAPELLGAFTQRMVRSFSCASDVYSFGVLLWEIWSDGRTPWGDDCSQDDAAKQVLDGGKLVPPSGCPQPIANLMNRCLDFDPAKRPKCDELYEALSEMFNKQEHKFAVPRQAQGNTRCL
eukprot:TRINITY_DN18958_c0_g1_i1.p1 TRINITY_DN18958_c0_g1~~TRINITY_DN18958_c0_g1_i1.p1  ORF type:complete len:398 (-),score=27.55 TRINITY_DN18958_c0_g1_i1:44-1237(-)